jgi:hypothetical protein
MDDGFRRSPPLDKVPLVLHCQTARDALRSIEAEFGQ